MGISAAPDHQDKKPQNLWPTKVFTQHK